MADSLGTLIRVGELEVDEARRAVNDLLRLEADLAGQQDALAAELDHERAAAELDPHGAGRSFAAYLDAWKLRRVRLSARRRHVAQQIERAREALADAYRALKTLQVSKDARDRRAAAELDRQDQIVLDEMALTMFRQNRTDTPHGTDGSG